MSCNIKKGKTTKFYNCKVLKNHKIYADDIWVRNGKIIDPEKVFFDEQIFPDEVVDCKNLILAPGFIDLQINGGFGIDFANNVDDVERGVNLVAKNILPHGVTSFCPTLVTSPKETYKIVLPKIKKRAGDKNGATILGVHLEGPFISPDKKGAHPPECMRNFCGGFNCVKEVYYTLEDVAIVTLAPELPNSDKIIKELVKNGVVVSLGHSMANLVEGERGCQSGATFITHLFNAMLPFHHRDPGLVGLLTSEKVPKPVFYGIISDGIHTHPAALRIAYRTHKDGLVIVTDAISALGLEDGLHHIGQFAIEVRSCKAYISGTDTLCGSMANMNECVQTFYKDTGCSREYALEAASLHPARVLGIEHKKGTLDFGADADFIMVDDDLKVHSTWIAGQCVYSL